MQPKSLEEISKMDELQILKALDARTIHVNDVDKAMLILGKFQNSRATKPKIEAECKHLEKFIKSYKFS